MGIILALLLTAGFSVAALADDPDSPGDETHSQASALPAKPVDVDVLLDQLATSDADSGKGLEAQILERFHDSGRPTINLLMGWAINAMQSEDYSVAQDLVDQIILLAPDFAEGWNKRATLHFLEEDFGKSISDIQRTLALQPRHFGALSGLGLILQDIGEDDRAMEAFSQALAVNPHLSSAKEALEALEEQAAGDEI